MRSQKAKVRLRLRRVHYLNGVRKEPGSIIVVSKAVADILMRQRVGFYVGRVQPNKTQPKTS